MAAGEVVLVTDRGKVVAELGPPRTASKPMTPEEKWQDMIRRGIVTPPRHQLKDMPRRFPMMSHDQLMREIAEDREDR